MGLPTAYVLGMLYCLSEMALQVLKRAKAGGGRTADRGSLAVLWLSIMVCMWLAYYFEITLPQASWPWQSWLNVLGIVVTIGGLVLRWYSIIHLGRFFTVNVAIAADHQLIDTGPYRTMRHPSYTGALLAFLGLALCMQNWASLLVLMAGSIGSFLYRIHVEERALTEAFGERYRQYMQRTARLIPGVY